MKSKRYEKFLSALCAILALGLCVFVVGLFIHGSAQATIATGQPQFGNTQLVLSCGSSTSSQVLNLSSSAAGIGISVPCYNMQLNAYTSSGASTSVGLFVGSSSSNCTFPIYPTPTSGTVGVQTFAIPQALNTNQLWFKLTNSTTGASNTNYVTGGTVNAMYTQ